MVTYWDIKFMLMANPNIISIIPIREGSERIRDKNFVEFADGRSLLEIKINFLKPFLPIPTITNLK